MRGSAAFWGDYKVEGKIYAPVSRDWDQVLNHDMGEMPGLVAPVQQLAHRLEVSHVLLELLLGRW